MVRSLKQGAHVADDGIEVFVKWVRRNGTANQRIRAYMTLATILSDDEDIAQLCREAPADWIDEALLEELLSAAEPAQLATLLSMRIGPHISVALFKRILDSCLLSSSDRRVHSALLFVAATFLDRHPGAFDLPRGIAEGLLASEEIDDRLAGLKALCHSTAPTDSMLAQITRALSRDDWNEKMVALSELRKLIDRKGSQRLTAKPDAILDELQKLSYGPIDGGRVDLRSAALHCIASLRQD